MADVFDVANCFLSMAEFQCENGCGDLMTDLKLQKMLYFAQGWHLARHGHTLFDSRIEAWQHGPVVPDIYAVYRRYGNAPLHSQVISDDALTTIEVETIRDVFEYYDRYSASGLRELSHQQGTPWHSVYEPGVRNKVIPIELMQEYFSHQKPIDTILDRIRNKIKTGEIRLVTPKRNADGIAILPAEEMDDWGEWDDT